MVSTTEGSQTFKNKTGKATNPKFNTTKFGSCFYIGKEI